MKTIYELSLVLLELEPEITELQRETVAYFDVCTKLQNNSEQCEKAFVELNAIATGKSDGNFQDPFNSLRFSIREQALLLLKASRQLANMSAKAMPISDRMGALTEDDKEDEA